LELNKYQDRAYKSAYYKDHFKIGGLTYTVLALCGESGELANKLKKALRKGEIPNNEALMDELGDVLWYVSAVATELGYDLEDVAKFNLDKLQKRLEAKKNVG
jgi:NTP pyrophosphatase (non-canonical NTP hydrolase)